MRHGDLEAFRSFMRTNTTTFDHLLTIRRRLATDNNNNKHVNFSSSVIAWSKRSRTSVENHRTTFARFNAMQHTHTHIHTRKSECIMSWRVQQNAIDISRPATNVKHSVNLQRPQRRLEPFRERIMYKRLWTRFANKRKLCKIFSRCTGQRQ